MNIKLFYLSFYLDGSCQLTPANKPYCKKCRYEKCLVIGMDPTLVLSDEEKRVRFKHFFKKKDAMEQRRSSAKAKKFIRQSLQSEPRPILPK